MKVLLFVQTGDARPKCMGEVVAEGHYRIEGPGDWLYTIRQDNARRAADRWWLVECENAEAGRAVIEHVTLDDNSACPINCPCCGGRILESGGRHA